MATQLPRVHYVERPSISGIVDLLSSLNNEQQQQTQPPYHQAWGFNETYFPSVGVNQHVQQHSFTMNNNYYNDYQPTRVQTPVTISSIDFSCIEYCNNHSNNNNYNLMQQQQQRSMDAQMGMGITMDSYPIVHPLPRLNSYNNNYQNNMSFNVVSPFSQQEQQQQGQQQLFQVHKEREYENQNDRRRNSVRSSEDTGLMFRLDSLLEDPNLPQSNINTLSSDETVGFVNVTETYSPKKRKSSHKEIEPTKIPVQIEEEEENNDLNTFSFDSVDSENSHNSLSLGHIGTCLNLKSSNEIPNGDVHDHETMLSIIDSFRCDNGFPELIDPSSSSSCGLPVQLNKRMKTVDHTTQTSSMDADMLPSYPTIPLPRKGSVRTVDSSTQTDPIDFPIEGLTNDKIASYPPKTRLDIQNIATYLRNIEPQNLNILKEQNNIGDNTENMNTIDIHDIDLITSSASASSSSLSYGDVIDMTGRSRTISSSSTDNTNEILKRKRQVLYPTGQWTRKEEAILLCLVQKLAQCELKVIAKAARTCGIARQPRAVDKKLKRLIGFKSWKNREEQQIRQVAQSIIENTPDYRMIVTEEMHTSINIAVKQYRFQA